MGKVNEEWEATPPELGCLVLLTALRIFVQESPSWCWVQKVRWNSSIFTLWSVTCVQLPHANSCSSFEWRIFYRWLFVWSTNPCTTVVRNLSSVSSGPRTSVSSETKARAPIAAVPEKKRCPERMGLLLREKWAVPHMGSLKAGALAILFQTGKREVGCGQLVRSVRGCAMIETSVSARC